MAAGADVDAPVLYLQSDGPTETPLHWAASTGDLAVLDALLDGGANIESRVHRGPADVGCRHLRPVEGSTPTDRTWRADHDLQAAALGVVERVRELCSLEPPTALEPITNAFWDACRGGQQATASYLLGRGADLNWIGHDDKTPYDVAEDGGDAALLEWLRASGARRAAEVRSESSAF